MNKVVAEITTENVQILMGDNNISVSVNIADDETIPLGCLLYQDQTTGAYKALASADLETNDAVAIALEAVDTAENAVITACIFGAVDANKLVFKDGSKITRAAITDLRHVAIYALGM